MKGTPEQIRLAADIKSKAIDRVLKIVKNKKTVDLIIQFADLKQDANWWMLKSLSGENFLITEHQKSISSDISDNNDNVCESDEHLKPIRLTDFQLPKWIVDWLKKQQHESGNILIEKALIQTYQIKPPEKKILYD